MDSLYDLGHFNLPRAAGRLLVSMDGSVVVFILLQVIMLTRSAQGESLYVRI